MQSEAPSKCECWSVAVANRSPHGTPTHLGCAVAPDQIGCASHDRCLASLRQSRQREPLMHDFTERNRSIAQSTSSSDNGPLERRDDLTLPSSLGRGSDRGHRPGFPGELSPAQSLAGRSHLWAHVEPCLQSLEAVPISRGEVQVLVFVDRFKKAPPRLSALVGEQERFT